MAQLEVGRSCEEHGALPLALFSIPPPFKKKKKPVLCWKTQWYIHSPACGDCKMPTGPFILSWRMVPETPCSLSTFSKPSDMAVAGSQGPQSLVRYPQDGSEGSVFFLEPPIP